MVAVLDRVLLGSVRDPLRQNFVVRIEQYYSGEALAPALHFRSPCARQPPRSLVGALKDAQAPQTEYGALVEQDRLVPGPTSAIEQRRKCAQSPQMAQSGPQPPGIRKEHVHRRRREGDRLPGD